MKQKHIVVLITNFSLTGAGVYNFFKCNLRDDVDLMCLAMSPAKFNEDIDGKMNHIKELLDESHSGDVIPIIVCYDMGLTKEMIETNVIKNSFSSAFCIYFDRFESVETTAKYRCIDYSMWEYPISNTLGKALFKALPQNDNMYRLNRIIGQYNDGGFYDDAIKLNILFWSLRGNYNKFVPDKFEAFANRFLTGFSGYYRKSDSVLVEEIKRLNYVFFQEGEVYVKKIPIDGVSRIFGLIIIEKAGYDMNELANLYIKSGFYAIFVVAQYGIYLFTRDKFDIKQITAGVETSYVSPRRYTLVNNNSIQDFLKTFQSVKDKNNDK